LGTLYHRNVKKSRKKRLAGSGTIGNLPLSKLS